MLTIWIGLILAQTLTAAPAPGTLDGLKAEVYALAAAAVGAVVVAARQTALAWLKDRFARTTVVSVDDALAELPAHFRAAVHAVESGRPVDEVGRELAEWFRERLRAGNEAIEKDFKPFVREVRRATAERRAVNQEGDLT